MAQFNSAEKIILQDEQADGVYMHHVEIEPTNVMTGDRNQSRFLYYQLKMSMMKAVRIDIIVSFLRESGVRMILNDLKNARIHLKICDKAWDGNHKRAAEYLHFIDVMSESNS